MKNWLKLWMKMRQDGRWLRLSDLASKVWVQCLMCAGQNEVPGRIPSPADVAWELHRADADVVEACEQLKVIGWLDSDDTGWFVPNFLERQELEKERESNKERQARYRGSVTERNALRAVNNALLTGRNGVSRCVTQEEERRQEETKGDETTTHARAPRATPLFRPAAWVPGFWLENPTTLNLATSTAMDMAHKKAQDIYGDDHERATARILRLLSDTEARGISGLACIIQPREGHERTCMVKELMREVEKSRKHKTEVVNPA